MCVEAVCNLSLFDMGVSRSALNIERHTLINVFFVFLSDLVSRFYMDIPIIVNMDARSPASRQSSF